MKKVIINTIHCSKFFYNDKEYKFTGDGYNSRIIAAEVNDPTKKLQFSVYDTVLISDEKAQATINIINDSIKEHKCRIAELERSLKLLKEQGLEPEW